MLLLLLMMMMIIEFICYREFASSVARYNSVAELGEATNESEVTATRNDADTVYA